MPCASMASQLLLRHHISSISNARSSVETGKFSTALLNSKLGNGLGKQLFCSRISSGRISHNKRFSHLRAQSVGESNSGAFSSGINSSWKSIVGEANLHKAVIPPPPDPPANGSFVQVLSYIWNLAAGDPSLHWRLSVAIILLFGSKLAGIGGPFLFKRAMDELANGSTKLQSEYYIYVVVSLLILSSLTKAISSGLNEVRYVVFAPLGHAVGRRIGVYLLQHILYLDLSFHLDKSSGVLLRILERAQRSVIHIFRAVVFTFIPTAIELVLVCALLSHQVGAAVAGIVLLAFLAYVIWTVKITTAASSSRIKANKFEEHVSGKAIDALLNYETVVQFDNQSIEVVQYNQLLQSYQHAMLDLEYLSATLNGGQAVILSVGIAAVMAVTGLQVAKGVVGIGSLVLVNGLILQVAGPLQFLGFLYRDLRQSLVDLDALFNILSIKPSIEDGPIELQNRGRGVSLKVANLHFSYKNLKKVLHGVSFTADPGESIAIVGPSGSGKSTIVKLLIRLYDPNNGTLFMDGHDICSLRKDSLRQAVAVVPQDTVLFNDTIFHNILYGLPTASEADVIRAARQAHLHEAVLQMPKGYMTVVGERGLKLSGGEKQRVAIARAFLKGPRLLICDEATSALDSSTEASILQSLKELATGRTCVFVLMYCGNAKRRLMQGSTPALAAIGILEVSAKILFDSGVQACLEYLEAMPWTEEEEVRLRNLLSQIHLDRNTVQDVLGRLHLPEHTGPEKLLMHVVQSVTKGTDEKARREMKCLVLRMIRENSIQDNEFASLFKDDLYSLCYGCLDSLVKLFMQATNKNLGNEVIEDRGSLIAQIARQVDNLNWLLEILVDRQIAEDFVRIWANQLELLELYKQTSCMVRYEVSRVTAKLVMTLGKRQILSPCEVRYNLLQAWLQPLVDDFGWIQRCCKGLDMKVVEEAISQTILTLPMKQQQSILLCWMEYFSNSGNDCPNLQKAFEVWWRRSFMPS